MIPRAEMGARFSGWLFDNGRSRLVLAVSLLCVSLAGCSAIPFQVRPVSALAPLQLDGHSVTVEDATRRVSTPDLLAVDQQMRDFVATYTAQLGNSRQNLMMLHRAVIGAATLDLQYDPFAQGSALEVFHRGSANCLSYANLFVALAREAGLEAHYQWLEMRPQWSRMGERLAVRLHVNVTVRLKNRERYMVDIDPKPARVVAGVQEMSDTDARALYHNNIAMDALAREDLEEAWLHAVRALQLSPRMSHLWVNMGAIYRIAGQHREAERSYLYALQLDSGERSAMNNLVVLYGIEGRAEEEQHWLQRIERYRDSNPYYHAWLGDQAGENDDWRQALLHYKAAVKRLPRDSRLLYATGMIHHKLDELQHAAQYIKRAIESATLRSEIETYQVQLEAVKREQVAGY